LTVRPTVVDMSSLILKGSDVKKLTCLMISTVLALLVIHSTESVSAAEVDGVSENTPTLRDEFSGHFLIGAALSENRIMGREIGMLDFVASQFSALTAENEMKWERIHPGDGDYQWASSDALVAFCKANDIFLTGHTLIWHQQTPDWVFEDENGELASRELLLQRMEEHINTIIGRFKGAIPSWDVVNEALNDDGSIRESKWQQIIGDDFVAKAFEFAHKADPNAKLYYNDYNLYQPAKRAGAVWLVKSVQDKGIPVHGIGMQGHYGMDHPEDLAQLEDSILAYAELGDVMITELDISILPFPDKEAQGADLNINLELKAKYNPYTEGLPADIQQALDKRYLDLFKVFLTHQDKISRVTFWGVDDGHSWKNGWPMQGRTDYPLLIDRDNKLKPVTIELFKLKDSFPLPVD